MGTSVLHIVRGLHNKGNYWQQGIVCLYSLLVQCTCPPQVHVLHDDTLDGGAQAHFAALCAHFSAGLTLHSMTGYAPLLGAVRESRLTAGALFKLLTPDCVPAERALYVDCDICFTLDIAKVFQCMDAAGSDVCLHMAPDHNAFVPEVAAPLRAMGLRPETYCNTGVIGFELERLAKLCPDFSRRVLALAARADLRWADQDALNLLLRETALPVQYLPAWCNFQLGYRQRRALPPEKLEGKVVHYTGAKPWHSAYPAGEVYAAFCRAAQAFLC